MRVGRGPEASRIPNLLVYDVGIAAGFRHPKPAGASTQRVIVEQGIHDFRHGNGTIRLAGGEYSKSIRPPRSGGSGCVVWPLPTGASPRRWRQCPERGIPCETTLKGTVGPYSDAGHRRRVRISNDIGKFGEWRVAPLARGIVR